ncbi:hypothetical protein F4818DRAFT_439931 [Hypoxylon cercidicola]|nr:hypothetical protein F4818DRAFT_439931 [Hypoxylon cercidicola]
MFNPPFDLDPKPPQPMNPPFNLDPKPTQPVNPPAESHIPPPAESHVPPPAESHIPSSAQPGPPSLTQQPAQPPVLLQGRPQEQTQDVYQDMPGYIGATRWAKPYYSNHHHENPQVNTKMLSHVNCGYLSTPGRPPTLEGLKQHAQSLTFLISTLAPSSAPGLVDADNNPNSGTFAPQEFNEDQAYDWLNNLQVPYDNIDKAHRRPLNSLANLVKKNSDEKGVEFHCPMEQTPIHLIEEMQETQTFPFQTHLTLLMHANECLERLDHEYSAMGGLLSIIPTDRDNVAEHPDLGKAKQTLVGQWLLYTQHLTGRMHELEIAYANALDVLAGEAMVPAQHLSSQGPDGRSGREIVFPQDRWLLANAGEDVYEFIHRMMDRKETWLDAQDGVFVNQHVVGDRLRTGDGADEDGIRGIVHVDLQTRFYRLKGSGRGTIFVLPAFADRPNTENTREMENRPTVVTLPTPTYPDRTTAWDRRNLGIESVNMQQSIDLVNKDQEMGKLKAQNETQSQELERLRVLNRIYEENQGVDAVALAQRTAAAETRGNEFEAEYERAPIERNQLRQELEAYKTDRREEQEFPVLQGVTSDKNGRIYTLSREMYERYASRSAAVDAAKVGVDRVKNAIMALVEQGQLDKNDFVWMDTVLNAF